MISEHDSLKKRCADYFRSRKGFARAFAVMKRKLESFGEVKGSVTLKNITADERHAFEELFGRSFRGKDLSFTLKSFESAVSETRFEGVTLHELLEEYFCETIIANKDRQAEIAGRKTFARFRIESNILNEFGEGNRFFKILRAMTDKEFSILVRTCLSGGTYTDERSADETVLNVTEIIRPVAAAVEFIDSGEAEIVRLSVLAMDCCGDPHGFDRDRTSGKLLIKTLRSLSGADDSLSSLSAEEILEIYISFGIRPDDISSFTVIYGIRLFDGEESHLGYDGFVQRHEFCLVSLSNLRSVTRAIPLNRRVFVVENQMLYSQLCDACPNASIICTSGQMKTASLLVIDLLCSEDCILYYNGDFDGEGLSIASRLVRRNREKIILWHMEADDYKRSISSVTLSAESMRKLENIKEPQLISTAQAILKEKKAGYQEMLLDILISDILSACD